MSAADPTTDEMAEYLRENYGTCRNGPSCKCLREEWMGTLCKDWVPTTARDWDEFKSLYMS